MEHEERSGKYVAAFMSSGIGLLTMSLVHLGSELSDAFKTSVHNIGKLWIPGADGIGPYSGKETLMLVAWAISWAVLSYILRDKKTGMRKWFAAFLVIVLSATLLIWPPILGPIVEIIKG